MKLKSSTKQSALNSSYFVLKEVKVDEASSRALLEDKQNHECFVAKEYRLEELSDSTIQNIMHQIHAARKLTSPCFVNYQKSFIDD